MKKTISSIIILCICTAAVLGLTACGSSGKDNNQPATAAQTQSETVKETENTVQESQPENSTDAFTFNFKGTAVSMKADAAPILEALGECKSYTEETSCAFDGLDKNYTYTSFIMTTYPDGDKDRVNSVTLRDDTVATAAGISIGDSQEKVEAAYGAEAFNGINAYIMSDESKNSQLTIILDNGKVSSIQYAALFE